MPQQLTTRRSHLVLVRELPRLGRADPDDRAQRALPFDSLASTERHEVLCLEAGHEIVVRRTGISIVRRREAGEAAPCPGEMNAGLSSVAATPVE
jgi:hypothetical protein